MSGARTSEHLVRLLNLLPYFQRHPERTLTEAAEELGVPYTQLKADLELLTVCGPGMLADELVDELGRLCMEVLLEAMDGQPGAVHSIPPRLCVRRSSQWGAPEPG